MYKAVFRSFGGLNTLWVAPLVSILLFRRVVQRVNCMFRRVVQMVHLSLQFLQPFFLVYCCALELAQVWKIYVPVSQESNGFPPPCLISLLTIVLSITSDQGLCSVQPLTVLLLPFSNFLKDLFGHVCMYVWVYGYGAARGKGLGCCMGHGAVCKGCMWCMCVVWGFGYEYGP